jgi:predicted dehydrogenase
MVPVRFGMIACSGVARRRFLPALRNSTCATLEAVGSRSADKAQEFAQEFGCSKTGDYAQVLNDPRVEAVYISTPPSEHAKWVNLALESGKHVICEKPMFPDFAAAKEAVSLARQKGVRLIEGFSFKWHPQHAAIRDLASRDRIGPIKFFNAEFTYPRPSDKDIRLNPELMGGVFHDSAGYPVAAALCQVPGKPVTIFSKAGADAAAGVDNSFSAVIGFSEGGIASLLVAFGAYYRSRYWVTGTKGRIELLRAFAVPPEHKAVMLIETDAGEERVALGPADQFKLMLEDVCASIRCGESRDFEGELLRQHAVMDAAAKSLSEGREVSLSGYQL